LHGFFGGHKVDIEFWVPEISNVLDIILPSTQSSIEDMKHGHHIGKIGLMVRHKEYVLIGQSLNDLATVDLQCVESLKSPMGKRAKYPNEPTLQK